MPRFDVTKLPANMRAKIMISADQSSTNGSACWEWTGAQNSRGYGSMTAGVKGKTALAHRRAYIELVGEIPDGLTIDHLCFNKLCVNVDHMEVVTIAENNRRKSARQTHCKQGHELVGENLRIAKRRDWTQRVCVTCQRAWGRASERRARANAKKRLEKRAA